MISAEKLYTTYQAVLNNCELFSGLSREQWLDLLQDFHEEKWTRNTCIINHQKFLFHFYIITSGRLKMYNTDKHSEKEHTLFLLKRSDVFDIFCLFDGIKHRVFYECLDDIKVLAIPMDKLRDWLKNNPGQYQFFLAYAGKMMRTLEENVSQLIFQNISIRLLKLLIENVNAESQKLELINDLPNKEIANLIGSTRAVVNRHLQLLKQNGLINIARNQLEVQDFSQLLKELQEQDKSDK
ncbi:Crp/Fnr family transcriptional regulator [Christiangramia sabulilitoris]|uniref:Crp/Fnr family transcriptional regulator n=1 Tax=Christiangramia sabulilitoris TaxID=2583991 RepID=A0A550I6D0_9FLAO|nr:Crp/Fnr family transcriptional regulator [Christiangramia sabulilitoris]TRO66532.1 Crp/Fnr family transcriptional regulator [Christiangramia sabulilitoris]